jgi:signal transduction histidine kinase
LRPEVLDDTGLVAAIGWQTTEFQKRTGVRCRTSMLPETVVFDADLSTTMFRIFQELLTNVARHANATRLDVELRQTADRLVLEVADNGAGMICGDASDKTSLGLLGMRERALRLGGTVDIRSSKGAGTRVAVSIPMAIPGLDA